MATFKDENGREWMVRVDVPAVKRLREHGLDILGIFDDGFKPIAELADDPCRLVDSLWIVCQEQAEKDGIGEEAFARRLFGDAIGDALNALVEAVADFFPNPKRRDALKAALRKIREAEATMIEMGAAQVGDLDAKKIADEVVSARGGPSTS